MSQHPLLSGILLGLFLFLAIVGTVTMFFLPQMAFSLNIGAAPGRTWTPAPTPTPRPTLTPTPAPAQTLPPDLPTPVPGDWTFKPGDVARNVNNGPVNLRRSPGYRNKPANDRIALVPAKATVTILSGPAQADGLIWWFVQWKNRKGWMAERRASGAPLLAPAN